MVPERERMMLLIEPIATLMFKVGTLGPRQQKGILFKFMQPVASGWGQSSRPFR